MCAVLSSVGSQTCLFKNIHNGLAFFLMDERLLFKYFILMLYSGKKM